MDKSDLEVNQVYKQIRSGKHVGEFVTIIRLTPQAVSYRPISKGGHTQIQQQVNIERFCTMFERSN